MGGPNPMERWFYAGASELGDAVSKHVTEGASLRFGVVAAKTDYTTHDTATITINGIAMPYLTMNEPQVGDWVVWLEHGENRLCIGEYGAGVARVKSYLFFPQNVAPNSVAAPGDVLFDSSSATEFQHRFSHSTSFLPQIFSPVKTATYDVACGVEFAGGNGSLRAVFLKVNGTVIAADWDYAPNALFPTTCRIAGPLELAAGDDIRVAYVHNASGNLDIGNNRLGTFFSAIQRCPNI